MCSTGREALRLRPCGWLTSAEQVYDSVEGPGSGFAAANNP
jgi:hypothetical protein